MPLTSATLFLVTFSPVTYLQGSGVRSGDVLDGLRRRMTWWKFGCMFAILGWVAVEGYDRRLRTH
jgi:hypothetical protein